MKISHESPLSMLEQSRKYNCYDYALVHLFETTPEYYNFFKESVRMGRHVLLDNSIFELGTSFDPDKFAYWIKELQPTEYVIPDVLENARGTMDNAESFVTKYQFLPGKKIGVVQGKTYGELVQCYRYLDRAVDVDKIAISFDYSLYNSISPHPNKWMSYTLGRISTLTKLAQDGIINANKPHHLLGCALPIEFLFYRTGFEWIETIDTSSPIVHGLCDIVYEPGGIINKQSIKLVDLLHSNPTDSQVDKIYKNISFFRSYVKGAV